jgi:hypothetical protein
MLITQRNPTAPWSLGEWRFGDRPEDLEAWLKVPDRLHIMIDFRSPVTPPHKWHRIMTVTAAWLHRNAGEADGGGVWPAFLMIPDGKRADLESSITKWLDLSWRLLVQYADLVPINYEDVAD